MTAPRHTRMSFLKRPRTADAPTKHCQPQFLARLTYLAIGRSGDLLLTVEMLGERDTIEIRLGPADAELVRLVLGEPRS